MINETILLKYAYPANSKMWSAFIVRLKIQEIYM